MPDYRQQLSDEYSNVETDDVVNTIEFFCDDCEDASSCTGPCVWLLDSLNHVQSRLGYC